MNKILDQQHSLFIDFTKKYGRLIRNLSIPMPPTELNLNLIDLLAKFNRDFQVTIDELDTLNSYFVCKADNNPQMTNEIQQKIKDYEEMNATIKQFMPYIILNNMVKQDIRYQYRQ